MERNKIAMPFELGIMHADEGRPYGIQKKIKAVIELGSAKKGLEMTLPFDLLFDQANPLVALQSSKPEVAHGHGDNETPFLKREVGFFKDLFPKF